MVRFEELLPHGEFGSFSLIKLFHLEKAVSALQFT